MVVSLLARACLPGVPCGQEAVLADGQEGVAQGLPHHGRKLRVPLTGIKEGSELGEEGGQVPCLLLPRQVVPQ